MVKNVEQGEIMEKRIQDIGSLIRKVVIEV